MPLLVRCEELQTGMRLAEPLVSSGRVLLQAGKEVNAADVEVLRRRFPNLHARVGDPLLDQAIEFEDDGHDREVAATVQQKVSETLAQVADRLTSRAALGSVNFHAAHQSVAEIMAYLREHPVSAALLTRSVDPDSYLHEHAGSVFYLSMVLGSAVRDYVVAERMRQTKARHLDTKLTLNLTPLGLGAMFADIGMHPLKDLLGSEEPLSKESRRAIREHPTVGAEMLPEDFPASAKTVVRTHHENMDGSGYPQGIPANKLHVFTRIVRIADAFDAATAQHVYKEAKSAARVIWEMTHGPWSRFYDPALIRVFGRLIQPFPIGARLQLQDGRYAVVVRYNLEKPFYPVVVVAFDREGNRLPKEGLEGPLSLEERRDLRIASYQAEDLSYIYHQRMNPETSVQPPAECRTLFEAAYP